MVLTLLELAIFDCFLFVAQKFTLDFINRVSLLHLREATFYHLHHQVGDNLNFKNTQKFQMILPEELAIQQTPALHTYHFLFTLLFII